MNRIVSLVALALVATSVDALARQVEPLAAPTPPAASAEDMGYAMGFQIGQQILAEQKELGSPVDAKSMAAGLADAVAGAAPNRTLNIKAGAASARLMRQGSSARAFRGL